MATIFLTARFRGQRVGVVHLDTESLDWIPLEMGTVIEKNAIPKEFLKLEMHSEKGTAKLEFRDAVPLSTIRWTRDTDDWRTEK